MPSSITIPIEIQLTPRSRAIMAALELMPRKP